MLWPCLRCADISYQTELLRRCLDQTCERDPRRSQDTTSTEQGAQPNAKPTQSSIWASFFRVALWVFTTRNTPWLNGLQCAVAPKAGNTATYSNHMGSFILFRLQFMSHTYHKSQFTSEFLVWATQGCSVCSMPRPWIRHDAPRPSNRKEKMGLGG